MSFFVRMLVVTILVPGTVSFALALASRRFAVESRLHRALVAAASALAVIAGSWGVMGTPTLTPLDISSWLPHVAIVAWLGAVAIAWADKPAVRHGVMAGAAVAIAYLLVRPLLAQHGGGRAAATLLIASGSLWAYAFGLDQTLRRASPRTGTTVALISTVAAAAAVAASGTLSVGQVGGAAAAGVGGLWLVVLVRPSSIAAAALPIAAAAWGLLALGNLYATLPLPIAFLVLAVPLAAAGAALVAARSPAPRKAAAIVLGATVVVAALGTALAIKAGLPADPATAEAGAGADDNYGYE